MIYLKRAELIAQKLLWMKMTFVYGKLLEL